MITSTIKTILSSILFASVLILISPQLTFAANITYTNPSIADLPAGFPASTGVVGSDLIGWRTSFTTSDSEFCTALGQTLVSSTRVDNTGNVYIAYWHTTNARWQDRRNTNDDIYTSIICDDGTTNPGTGDNSDVVLVLNNLYYIAIIWTWLATFSVLTYTLLAFVKRK